MNDQESVFDNEAIGHFYSDVLHQLFPKARHQSISFLGAAEVKRADSIRLELADSNEINIGSPYFYDKPYKFIHYTNVSALMNILRTKKVRLYNLYGMDDKNEFVVPLRHNKKNPSEYEINEIKKKIFCLSMCETSLEEKEKSLSSWREYGDKGKGVGIVLSFNEDYLKEWVYYSLSKIYYTVSDHRQFQKLQNSYNIFKSKYNLSINNFDMIMYKYFGYHKHNIYKAEREVRLLYSQGLSYIDKPPIHHDLNKSLEGTTFIELEIEWNWDEKTREYILKQNITPHMVKPVISIDNIILGYRIGNNAKYEIAEVVQALTKDYKKKPDISNSKLTKHF